MITKQIIDFKYVKFGDEDERKSHTLKYCNNNNNNNNELIITITVS